MEFKDIVSLAKKCVYNVEKKHTANVDNTRNYTTNAYTFSKSILRIGKAVGVKRVPVNPKPQHTVINGGIGIKNFEKLCQLYVNWVDKHGQAPAYLRFNDKKIGIDTWAYATARVVTYYWEKKKLPNKVIVTSKIFDDAIKEAERKKREAEQKAREEAERQKREQEQKSYRKYGHAEEYGCDNRGQNTGYYCACHSLQEVFRNLTGIVVSQETIAEIAGTTYDGTDHEGMNTVVAWFNRKYGFNLVVSWRNFSELGWNGIREIEQSSNMDCILHIMYRYLYGHYEVVNKVYDDEILVQNSLGDYCSNGCYCGYEESRSPSEYRDYINLISQKSVMVITNET